jgi:hypothetical protein
MVLQNFDPMQTDNIQITLIRLQDGSRLLRLSEPETGLALERALNPNRSVVRQKQQFKALFESMIQSAGVLVAA